MLVHSNDLFPMLFNNVFNSVNDSWNRNSARDPQINISESKLNYKIEFSVPGLSKEDLTLTLDTDNNLVVSMDRKVKTQEAETVVDKVRQAAAEVTGEQTTEQPKVEQPAAEEFRYLRRDFHLARFKEAIALPDNIHKDKITAKVENGILRILLPKVTPEEQAQLAKTITIE